MAAALLAMPDGGRPTDHPDLLEFAGVDPTRETLVLRNNILYTNMHVAQRAGFTHEYNLYHIVGYGGVGFALGVGELRADPLFQDRAGGNLRLWPGSPAEGAGVDLGYRADFEDYPLPVGRRPDLGAYQATRTTAR